MNGLVERMARAILLAADDDRRIQGFLYGNAHVVRDVLLPQGQQELWRVETDDYQLGHDAMMFKIASIKAERQALAALKAMRDPTEAMLEAGPPAPYMDAGVWARMIDAAIQEHSTTPPRNAS